jgi:glycogen operon protein
LERIAADPVLAQTTLIAEPWDAAGLYQVGVFPRWGRWAEWNDQFRDHIRRFVKGDDGMVCRLSTRLTGSADLYPTDGTMATPSVNFATCHDGFTLADVVQYSRPHNAINGEARQDGAHENFSWNCGEEGPSGSPQVNALRRRQIKNMATLVLLSQGVPMILSGDEIGRTQQGNNNAYCHDSELTWINWNDLSRNGDLFRFFKHLIHFRNRHSVLRRRWAMRPEPGATAIVTWHGIRLGQPDWSDASHTLAMHLASDPEDIDLFLMANAHWEPHVFELPPPPPAKLWRRCIDTAQPSPDDISSEDEGYPLADSACYPVSPRSIVVLVGQ